MTCVAAPSHIEHAMWNYAANAVQPSVPATGPILDMSILVHDLPMMADSDRLLGISSRHRHY